MNLVKLTKASTLVASAHRKPKLVPNLHPQFICPANKNETDNFYEWNPMANKEIKNTRTLLHALGENTREKNYGAVNE